MIIKHDIRSLDEIRSKQLQLIKGFTKELFESRSRETTINKDEFMFEFILELLVLKYLKRFTDSNQKCDFSTERWFSEECKSILFEILENEVLFRSIVNDK